MKEIILRINEDCSFKKDKDDGNDYEGFIITTDKQDIKIGISRDQCCCETFGYFASEDDFSDFIGAEIIDITLTDTELKTDLCKKNDVETEYMDEGELMFVNINTNKGTLQFVAYNMHNGYYGHNAIVISEQLKIEEIL